MTQEAATADPSAGRAPSPPGLRTGEKPDSTPEIVIAWLRTCCFKNPEFHSRSKHLMKSRPLALILLGITPALAAAANLFTPGDFIIAIDTAGAPTSGAPAAEGPANAVDGNPGTKYLNFGEERSGLILTPAGGPSTIQSMVLTTANDAPDRDPASFSLYGTNSPILSGNHSLGNAEPWTLIATSTISLPTTRLTASSPIDFANALSFTSYRLVFDTVVNAAAANSMQIADIQFYSSFGAVGAGVLGAGTTALAIDLDFGPPSSSYPGGEAPANAIDGTPAKYLNFGENGSGFIITPGVGLSVVDSFQVMTANDAVERDPSTYSIYGTNDPISSGDNSQGNLENWILIQSGGLNLPTDRDTLGDVISVANTNAYTSYRVIFDGVRDGAAANSMQVGDIQFFGTVVPEPGSAALAMLALLPLARRRR